MTGKRNSFEGKTHRATMDEGSNYREGGGVLIV